MNCVMSKASSTFCVEVLACKLNNTTMISAKCINKSLRSYHKHSCLGSRCLADYVSEQGFPSTSEKASVLRETSSQRDGRTRADLLMCGEGQC